MINLYPTKCNICNGKVILTDNNKIYGKKYGSGKIYFCTKCKAYVGTHKPRPTEALGLLANNEMRSMKKKCHDLFDTQWKSKPTSKERYKARQRAYRELAVLLNIPLEECHFGYFDLSMLIKAYNLLSERVGEQGCIM